MKRTLVLLVFLLAFPVFAQQFFASGSFAKPVQVVATDEGVLRDATGVYIQEDGTIYTIYAAPQGLFAASTEEDVPPRLLGEHSNIRDFVVGDGDEFSSVFVGRNRSNGRSHYVFQTLTEQTELFDLGEQLSMESYPNPAGAVFITEPLVGGSRLVQLTKDARSTTDIVVHESDESIRAVSAVSAGDERLHLVWLEGDRTSTAFGSISDWTTYYQLVDASTWEPLSEQHTLGVGDVLHSRDRSAVAEQDGTIIAVWPNENRTFTQAVGTPETNTWEVTETQLSGRIIGATNDGLYWYDGTSIYFSTLPINPGATMPNPYIASPVSIEGANLHHRMVDGEPHTAIAWFGRSMRGTPEVYLTHTFESYTATWWDSVIASFGWNPWNYGEQFAGQALTAMVIAAVGGLILLVVVWIIKSIVSGFFPNAHPQRQGEYMAAGVFVLFMALFSYGTGGFSAVLKDGLFLVPIALVSILLSRLWRPGNRQEPFLVSIISSYLVLFLTITIWVFITYPRWATLVGLP